MAREIQIIGGFDRPNNTKRNQDNIIQFTAKKEVRERIEQKSRTENIEQNSRRQNTEKKKGKKKSIKGIMSVTALAAILFIGGMAKGHIEENREKEALEMYEENTDKQAEFQDKLASMQKQVQAYQGNSNNFKMNEENVNDLLADFNKLQYDLIKSQVSNNTGVAKEDVKLRLRTSNEEQIATIEIGDTKYKQADMFDFFIENTISLEIKENIEQIVEVENIISQLEKGAISKQVAIDKLVKYIDKEVEFSQKRLLMDKKGHMFMVEESQIEKGTSEQQEKER